MVLFQIASDLHLNDYPNSQPFSEVLTPSAPILVLAGDICPVQSPQYEAFLTWCSRNWQHVLVTTGNHEYYTGDYRPQNMSECDRTILIFLTGKLPNVIYLQAGNSVVLEGVRFIGATLWSKIDSALWSDPAFLRRGDYNQIFSEGRRVTPALISAIHGWQKARLASAIAASAEPVVVVTHHLPTAALVPQQHKTSSTVSAYATNCEELMTANVRAWICGHSHEAKQWTAPSGCFCIVNPRGYSSQDTGFSAKKVIELALPKT